MEEGIKDLIESKSRAILQEAIEIRRQIHANPELSFEEFETAKLVQKKLTEWGIPYKAGIVNTGVVGFIKANQDESKCIALRADLDALPIQENNDIPYKSTKQGIMHACGHDVHTAMLLGAAKVLNELRDQLNVSVKLIFQPGEEKLPGGAKLMIAEGVLENPKVSEIYALHVFPELEVGKIGLKPGMYMASCDEIYITVKGKGGHGAMPHQNIDPILISSHLIVALQQIISRNCPPQIPSVLSFGYIEGKGATNVIPNNVYIQGTFRTMDEQWRKKAHENIQKQAKLLVESFGGEVDCKIEIGYPYLENDPELTNKATNKMKTFLGDKNVIDLPIRLTGEDFAYYSQQIPATFIRIGVRNEKEGIVFPVHNSQFNIDEKAILIGIQTLVCQALTIN
jgi:amidohydrolase